MAKYLICPGVITSKNDGDMHYISAHDLIRLYNVDPKDLIHQMGFWGTDEALEKALEIANKKI